MMAPINKYLIRVPFRDETRRGQETRLVTETEHMVIQDEVYRRRK